MYKYLIHFLNFLVIAKGKELEDTKKRLHEASEKLQERGRQHHKLQVLIYKICAVFSDNIFWSHISNMRF